MKITPKKSLGQNFLANPRILEKICAIAKLAKSDTVIEVGPGTGTLTKKLLEKAGKVIAIEKDHRLIAPLKEKFGAYGNFELLEADVLELKIEALIENWKLPTLGQAGAKPGKIGNYKVVANLPYYITSNFLRTVFEEWPKPELIVLTVQKEVAQRIIAAPPHMNILALSVQIYSKPEIAGYISKNNFFPPPKVDSAIIRLNPKSEILNPKQIKDVLKLIKTGFGGKRKQLANNLANSGLQKDEVLKILSRLGIDARARAENLSLDEWLELARQIFGQSPV